MKNLSNNPIRNFRIECELVLRDALVTYCNTNAGGSQDKLMVFNSIFGPYWKDKNTPLLLEIPSSTNFGDLSSSVCLEAASKLNTSPKKLADKLVSYMTIKNMSLLNSVKAVSGYINFYIKSSKLTVLTLEAVRKLVESYGYIKIKSPLRIIVEHTSVNPVGPIHVGTARNSILGDSLSRLLKARGHKVSTHFYIDDVGRQIAVLAYGYKLLDRSKPTCKPDHWIGLVYAITCCIIEIEKLKKKLNISEYSDSQHEQINEVRLTLDNWISAAFELKQRNSELFESLLDRIKNQNIDPEESISSIMQAYERNDLEIKKLIREVVNLCLSGFSETYNKIGILWDSWDWESDLVWSGAVKTVSDNLKKSPYFATKEGAVAFDAELAANRNQLKKRFGLPEEQEIPLLVLSRSDGTTLYSTRDIAYSLWKLNRADKVINVIGVEQSLAQLQIRIATSVLTSIETAEKLIHYAYELVTLLGYRMSKRRGQYITLDEIIEEASKRAIKEVNKKSPDLSPDLKKKISESVGIGAVKYALINVAPSKKVTFTWDKVLNFEMNSAPFIQYAYARACNILEKAGKIPPSPSYLLLKESAEMELVKTIALFPETFIQAVDRLMPSQITDYAYDLAAKFNSFYSSLPVLKAKSQGLKDARLALVDSVRITLKNALDLIGIDVLERM